MKDPRQHLLENIQLTQVRVEFSSPVVLLCGGVVKQKSNPNDPDPPVLSLRAALNEAILRKEVDFEVFRPEEIGHWQADSTYKNLMDFEADLASICSLIVIILESAGSIAELGAFSQLEDLNKKLVVIKSDRFNDTDLENSFINLGILRFLTEKSSNSVKSYPWDITLPPDNPPNIDAEVVYDVIDDIQGSLRNLSKTEVFKVENQSHVTVLIYELICCFVALKESEILHYINKLGIDLSKGRLKGRLFLLEHFKFITKQNYSDAYFYLENKKDSFHSLRLTYKDGKAERRETKKLECMEYYNQSKDPIDRNRKRAISQKLKGGQL